MTWVYEIPSVILIHSTCRHYDPDYKTYPNRVRKLKNFRSRFVFPEIPDIFSFALAHPLSNTTLCTNFIEMEKTLAFLIDKFSLSRQRGAEYLPQYYSYCRRHPLPPTQLARSYFDFVESDIHIY